MKAILIDPFECQITEVDYDGDFRSIHKLLHIDTFTAVQLGSTGETLFVDDEGLYKTPKNQEEQHYFLMLGQVNPFAGYGLILGTNIEGESIATSLSAFVVKQGVLFLGNKPLQMA